MRTRQRLGQLPKEDVMSGEMQKVHATVIIPFSLSLG